jgi:hypothetical protein
MASGTPLSADSSGQDMKLTMPPPPLLPRPTNEVDRPSTPKQDPFTSPVATPSGSPSKSKLPPGAKDLANVFEKNLRLDPLSPTKPGRQQAGQDSFDGDATMEHIALPPGSPLKRSDKENTPPSARSGKDLTSTPTHAALSRQEQYQTAPRERASVLRGLSPEDLEKLQLPKVKRLANVTQICKHLCTPSIATLLTNLSRLPRLLL